MIKLVSDTIDREDINALIEWLQQDPIPQLTKGPLTLELEKKWANKINSKYSVFVNSGSSALFLKLAAMKEFNYLKNNKIVVPALSWATDLSSPMLLGFESLLCDCNLEDLSCDLNHLEYIFKKENPSVLLSVAPLGFVPRMKELVELCDKYNVVLLEDLCETMGSKYGGKYLGNFGLCSSFSMYYGHTLSSIEGGFINTNDENLYHALLMMRSHGWDRDLPKEVQTVLRTKHNTSDFDALYNFYVPGMNLRSTDLQAFIGLRAIDKLDNYSEIRNRNYKLYKKYIKTSKLILDEKEGDFVVNFAYPVISENREELVKELKDNNIEVRPLIAGNMGNKPMWYNKYNRVSLPNADLVDKKGLYLPNHHGLTENDIVTITNIINKY